MESASAAKNSARSGSNPAGKSGRQRGVPPIDEGLIATGAGAKDVIILPKSLVRPAASIKIFQQDYSHLDSSPLNQAFKLYNQFIALTFKNKGQYNTALILPLAKQL